MDEMKQGHPHTEYEHEHGHNKGPYWKRAHKDWKLWAAVVLMLIAMAVYVRSNDLSVRPNHTVQTPVP